MTHRIFTPRIFLAMLALTLVVGVVAAARASGDQRLLVILTSAETETQAMTLVLSNQVARSGTAVHLLLCGPAGDLALREPPAQASRTVTPKGMSVTSLLAALKSKGAAVDVCAIYLPNRDLGPQALADGVGVARPPAIAAEMMAGHTRLFTF